MRQTKEESPLRIDKNLEMPTIPVVLCRVLGMVNDDSSSARQLEELILHDPALASRILKLANSAFYSFRSEVKTVSHAISLLGFTLVRSIAIGVSIFDSFTKGMKSEARLIHQLWMHSFAVALLTQEIWTPRASRKDKEFAFLCGLLHDLGKVFFFKKDPTKYSPLFAVEKSETDQDLLSYETEFYGLNHAMVGAILARGWGLPEDLALVLGKHHDPPDPQVPLAAAVSLADYLAKRAQLGFDGEVLCNVNVEALLDFLKMSSSEFDRLCATSDAKRMEIETFFKHYV